MAKTRLRRGFKTEAEGYALDFRNELGLRDNAPLCPRRLAEHLEIPLVPLSSYRQEIPGAISILSGEEISAFSAVTVFIRSRRIIAFNDFHHPNRQASDISHELAHAILGHPPTPPLSEAGCRNFDLVLEEEANWLGQTLLIPRPAAIRVARLGLSLTDAANEYKVSEPLMRMRLHVTGAYLVVSRMQARRGGMALPARRP